MRSKAFLVSNILTTIYSIILIFIFGNIMIEKGGIDYINYIIDTLELCFDLGVFSNVAIQLFFTTIGFFVHVIMFIIGCVLEWLAYINKKSGVATISVLLYLIGTICFPPYIFFGLPVTIFAFIGCRKQKKLNKNFY